jgi:NADPH-dependent 2,4-dienoyl-CoA reductase/sulfur reductase-like enzyme
MSAATRLRRLDESAEIVVYEMGEHVSYANCGLPYFVSGVISNRDDLLLQTPASLWRRFRIEVKNLSQVQSIDPEAQTITVSNLASGEVYEDSYDKLIISTGAKPRKLDLPGFERALSLRNVTDADLVRAEATEAGHGTAAIIGGGFIGIEVAENLRELGLQTSIVHRGASLLAHFDIEMIEPLQQRLEQHGVKLFLNAQPVSADANQVLLADGGVVDAAILISAAGVIPDNQLAKQAGLRIGKTGGLWVDEQQRTSESDIFAAGDAVEKLGLLTGEEALVPLANLANRHGRLAADAIAGLDVSARPALSTAIIGAFGLAAGITGLNERQAEAAGIDYQVIHLHPSSHAGYYPGAKRISLKVLFEAESGLLIGAQATGEDGVDKRIDIISTAISGGLTVDELMDLELSYAPQFGSAKDAVNQAGYVGNNVLSGRTPTLQWHELAGELAAGAGLIDVRSATEHAAGGIPNSVNISVDELRERMAELPAGDLVVHCQVGQRGHIATQILLAAGRSVKNLDGGYLTWKAAMDAVARS